VFLSVLGLLLRAVSHSYALFFVGQALAALAYPLLISPIGSVLRMAGITQRKMATGLTIGFLFLGMSFGAFLGGRLGTPAAFWTGWWLNLLVGIWLVARVPKKFASGNNQKSFHIHLRPSVWWLVGFVVASTSVMIGGIATPVLGHMHVASPAVLGGLLSGLTFLGSAVGAILFGALGERGTQGIRLQRILALCTWLSLLGVVLDFSGVVQIARGGLEVLFFLLGAFGNGWYSLALEESARVAADAGSAGLNTAGFSMASNIGVAVIPTYLGVMVLTHAGWWAVLTLILGILGLWVPFSIKKTSSSNHHTFHTMRRSR
jgi:predicted MFS family arabinose efflux permease